MHSIEELRHFLNEEKNSKFSNYFKSVSVRCRDSIGLQSFRSLMNKKGFNAETEEIRSFYKNLSNFGLGSLTREGAFWKFEWRKPYSQKYLKKILMHEDISEFSAENNFAKKEKDVLLLKEMDDIKQNDDKINLNKINYPFVLRKDCVVHLELPDDFRENEAQRLIEFIKTLPINY